MSTASRKYILDRRGAGIGDLSAATFTDGDTDLAELVKRSVYTVNCSFQVGIATSTEVGLSPDRFPIRVILVDKEMVLPDTATETVVKYWGVVDRAGQPIPFSRKPLASDLCIRNLYAAVRDLDSLLWTASKGLEGAAATINPSEVNEVDINALYDLTNQLIPSGEQVVTISQTARNIIARSVDENKYPCFKVAEDAYILARPHGFTHSGIGVKDARVVATHETVLCANINRDRLRNRYPDLEEGVTSLAGLSVAAMFRYGMYESYEHQEYYTVQAVAVAGTDATYSVAKITAPKGYALPTDIKLGDTWDIHRFKVYKPLVELANTMVMGSGLMHYLFNHTTGGNLITGVLLTSMNMYNLVNGALANETHLNITSLMYDALHPVNKRAIANLFFDNAGVTTYGRCSSSPRVEEVKADSFISIRCTPYPAGSHKAMICLQALRRVLQAGLGPFLPWADQITPCITTCTDVLRGGARAHIGSHYYTGEPSHVQPASIDQYLPELAQYVRTFNRGDSLGMSPHMSDEIAKRAGMNWQNLLKDLKAKDISSTSSEVVREFLKTAGGVYFTFNPDDQNTWARAAADARVSLKAIDNMFN